MARDETQAMSTERLAEIHENWTRVPGNVLRALEHEIHLLECDRTDLLAEVERQRAALDAKEAREAALLAVVEKVWTLAVQSTYDGKWFIPHVHAAHILIEQARALLASAETGELHEQAAQIESAQHCDYCSQPWAVQAWRVNMEVREWLCAAHFDDLSSDRLYRIERDRRSEQGNVLYSDEEAEAAYHSYEDDVVDEQAAPGEA